MKKQARGLFIPFRENLADSLKFNLNHCLIELPYIVVHKNKTPYLASYQNQITFEHESKVQLINARVYYVQWRWSPYCVVILILSWLMRPNLTIRNRNYSCECKADYLGCSCAFGNNRKARSSSWILPFIWMVISDKYKSIRVI